MNVSKGFSLIEVLFAIFIVSITLAGLIGMSASFQTSRDKNEAIAIAEMITHSIFSAMRLNPEGFRKEDKINFDSNFDRKGCIDPTAGASENCNATDLAADQLYYLKAELFDHFACSDSEAEKPCLNLEKSYIEMKGECDVGIEGLDKAKLPKKTRIEVVVQRGDDESSSKSFSQISYVCI